MVLFLVGSASLQLLLDYGTHGLEWSMRVALTAVIAGTALWILWRRTVAPMRVRFGPAETAKLVERYHPQLGSLLVSAVRFSSGDVGPAAMNSRDLMASAIRSVGERARPLDFDAVLDPSRAKRCGLGLSALVLVCVVAVVAKPDVIGLWFVRNVMLQEVEWPKRTYLVVDGEGEELIGARGDDLVIQARARGVQPRTVEIEFETASGQRGREVMVTVGSRGSYQYRYTFPNAQEDLDFRLEGGDDRTELIHARLLDRPQVSSSEMAIVPPGYTRLPVVNLGDGQRTAQVLPGGDVAIRIGTNKPVVQATLMAGRDVVTEGSGVADQWMAMFSPDQTHTYQFALVDEVGLENKRPVRFSIRVINDDPPKARMQIRGAGAMITPEAILPIELEFSDTYGLATAELVYLLSREGSEPSLIPLPSFAPSTMTFTTSVAWPISSQAMVPGEAVTLHARASDFNDVTGPGTATAPETTLRVVTREELMAELARREQEYRMDFERLIDSQEQLRSGLLTVLGRGPSGAPDQPLAAELAPLERRQRNIAGSVNVIRQQLEQILAELAVNQLDTPEERERLGVRIVDPLTRLAKTELVLAADIIRQWSREETAERASQVDPHQVEILTEMRSVLASMIQWEGYQEVVGMLRDIIRLQQGLRAETKETLQDQGRDVFDK